MSDTNKPIILDATSAEFSGELQLDEQLWQRRGFRIALEHIDTLVKEAAVVSDAHKNAENKTLPRIHDAIFISGGRGTGKTVFLYNLAKQWRDSEFSKNTRIKFLEIIDPTLLISSDNFVNVIIAHIHNEVSKQINNSNYQQEYHRILNELASSLGQSEYGHRDATGIDRIIDYQSAMDLEHCFHKYVSYCCEKLEVKAIVMPIDDVDMALTRAHDLLETIRRLLSCPQLIPVVCGDEKIYRDILLDHFEYAGRDDFQHRKVLSREGAAKHLAKQYWRKVFPEQLRIGLLSLEFLTINMEIHGRHQTRSVRAFLDLLVEFITPLVNGEGGSHNFPMPDTPRKLTQIVKQFYGYFDLDDKEQSTLNHYNLKLALQEKQIWHNLMVHSQTSGFNYGVLLGHSEAMWRDEYNINQHKLNIVDLPLFNIFKQAEICREKAIGKTS